MANGEIQEEGAQEPKKSARDRSKSQVVLALDADRLGLTTGALVATIVMALSFLQQADGLAVSFRTGIAFVGTYAATFFFVRIVLRSTLFELVLDTKDKTLTKLGGGASASAASGNHAPADVNELASTGQLAEEDEMQEPVEEEE